MSTICGTCGMPCGPAEYHPYAACLMFMACHDSETVRANLPAVEQHGTDKSAAPAANALAALRLARDGFMSMRATGLPCLPHVVVRTLQALDAAIASPPADARDADARDAARYRWLRDTPWPTLEFADIIMQHMNARWDAAIDAAMSAAPSSAGGEA